MTEMDGLFPPLDVWVFPRPVETGPDAYGPNGEAVAALLIEALELDRDALYRIGSAFHFNFEHAEKQRAEEERIREAIYIATASTGRADLVRSAFAAGERVALYAASPALGSLEFWHNDYLSATAAPVGYAAAALVVADALTPADLDMALRSWRARANPPEARGASEDHQ
jgi:hypothetical protein